ncbi:hypothetical protein SAMN05216464_111137 [Mucilaginibacter pineti]|uniref:Uncharacterized protein n=1 Tax=Mucilaginibacter pineti TaxID=1391627 RepID=A0A1G7HA67_9SPHI|nr:hypothetical protein [Mucilaginibacter pineti]SDE97347.1 hypothetical protein SAMN05216464_111137 [Mucilaginibacter pineti]
MMPDCIRSTNPEDYEVQMDRFAEGLLRVQQRHYYWFESRHGENITQDHDTIGNHVVINFRYPVLTFGYWSDSQLPENIRAECNACFDQIFKRS